MNTLPPLYTGGPEQMATRKAALVLHSLGTRDRHWMLQRLPSAHRELLQPLLDELAQLGLPADPGLVNQVLGGLRSLAAVEPVGRSTLEQASAPDIDLLVRGEPDALVGKLLSLFPWRWRDDFIALLPATRRGAIILAEASSARDAGAGISAPDLAAALLQELEARLGDLPQAARPARRLLSRWRKATIWLGAARRPHARVNLQ